MSSKQRQVHICLSGHTANICDKLPSNLGRLSLIDSLISAFGLYSKCLLVNVVPASAKELCVFHDEKYVAELLKERHEENTSFSKEEAKYGLLFDCPPFAGLHEYVLHVTGSSLSAANVLLRNRDTDSQHVVINWYGGRHHAHKAGASGFCYVNDIVLAILRLRTLYRKIFYLDVDLHHGDGVEAAFRFLKFVTTCSVHRHDLGFFPGTGNSSGAGAYNIPTKRGLGDKNFKDIIARVVAPIIAKHTPDIIVVQCGSDGLASDPSGEWNLSIDGLASSISGLVDKFQSVPFLVLGGGGYNHTETARFSAWLTKTLIGDVTEWGDIPEHACLDAYENDGFQFWTPGNKAGKPARCDENKDIGAIRANTLEYLWN
ncbi:Arginase/deacetylase [Metschnikowia bicuspidata var. bicuspidata NRRL YB-4993]|uniref:Histone deacetylase 8 n=1 Tax=Metschnikowia bicuspidata var. bicuspidata NRRL YB-4993 TaxID=869754 RepID=A0A1A0HF36_9ASCO|nr:Arginase/deacetylase [Metschnikowia bicuspidata var. bicuspidata NRRL YB-4993]OBA22744.1 Arginase/deacetylase [Metschnikowia bicuspidata var. bicuspidata NRRL YB-4993]